MTATAPKGFKYVPPGQFVAGPHRGTQMDGFYMKATPVTNAEYGAVAAGLGQDRFVLLRHDWQTGETRLEGKGATEGEFMSGPLPGPTGTDYDGGQVMILGSAVLLRMDDNPSAKFDSQYSIFSGADQPAVGLTYFHAVAWCLLKSLGHGRKYQYDLPTDLQFQYVASDRGTKEYGTETGSLFENGRPLVHIMDKNRATVSVHDPRYGQIFPFGVQTTGNVYRWAKFNPHFKDPKVKLWGPYGVLGGGYGELTYLGQWRADFRLVDKPDFWYGSAYGFSPVALPVKSKKVAVPPTTAPGKKQTIEVELVDT